MTEGGKVKDPAAPMAYLIVALAVATIAYRLLWGF